MGIRECRHELDCASEGPLRFDKPPSFGERDAQAIVDLGGIGLLSDRGIRAMRTLREH